jgi:hypothetical protein
LAVTLAASFSSTGLGLTAGASVGGVASRFTVTLWLALQLFKEG